MRKYLQQLEQGTVVEKEGPLPKEIEPDEEDMAHDIEGLFIFFVNLVKLHVYKIHQPLAKLPSSFLLSFTVTNGNYKNFGHHCAILFNFNIRKKNYEKESMPFYSHFSQCCQKNQIDTRNY